MAVHEVKRMAQNKGIRIHQYLDNWLVRATSFQTCLQHTQTLVALCQKLGWVVNMEKSEMEPKQIFDFVGYQFDLREGKVRSTFEQWQAFSLKVQGFFDTPFSWVNQLISLVSLLTASKKQVPLSQLHTSPIQWHLKNHWRTLESLEKVIPIPRSLYPHLKWGIQEANVLQGQPLQPLSHTLQIITDTSRRVITEEISQQEGLSSCHKASCT